MSLYNDLFGENEYADYLLGLLKLQHTQIPRYRDCFFHDGKIIIHTRTGGANRKDYIKQHEELMQHPLYLSDQDDSFDPTYADFYFQAPESISVEPETTLPREKWKNFNKKLKNNGPFTDREQIALNKIKEQIENAMKSKDKLSIIYT